jgi:hypothetical protein
MTITQDEFKQFVQKFLLSIEKDPRAVTNLLSEASSIERNAGNINEYDPTAASIMIGIVANYRAAANGLQNLRNHYTQSNRN